MFRNYICALDIGSSKIAAAVAELERGRISNVFFEHIPAKGVKRGLVIDSPEFTASVGDVLKNLKAKSGINIKFIYTAISGQDIITKHSRAIIPLSERGNKVITPSDIHNVNEQARILGANLEEEIICQIPLSYTIDAKTNVVNPLGLYGHSLEVDLYLISARLSCIQSLSRAINQAGYEVKDLFFSGMATQRAVSNPEFNEETNILCDIGSDIIEILIFKDGILSHLEILSFGGNDLTQQLAEALKIPFELAEEVKKSYASVGDYSRLKEEKEILIKKSSIYAPIKHKLVVEVVTAGARLISQKIKDAIEKFGPSSAVNNFIATGRTVLLEGFLETLEDILRVPVKLGRFTEQQIIPFVTKDSAWSGQKYLVYLTCAGIILEAMHEQRPKILSFKHPAANPVLKAVTKFKEIYQEYF